MKEKLVVASVYAVAFFVVTGAIAVLNNTYNNIFKLDFSPPVTAEMVKSSFDVKALSMIKKNIETNLRNELSDSIQSIKQNNYLADSNYHMTNTEILDSIKVLKEKLIMIQKNRSVKTESNGKKGTENQENEDNLKYKEWVKTTSGLYESMEANQAAKIITKYSDNVARDIIYSMKKKKAAEILAALNPETANRITRVKQ
ncbi:MAG: hypothetical protein JW995_07995 [Melioribacteraceae bacterium]|nr:hypothetical protein [Melioribacteraceae bacterium]